MQLLEPEYQDVLNARTQVEFKATLVSFAARLEFSAVSGLTVIENSSAEYTFIPIDNLHATYRSFASHPANGRRCPVLQHRKTQTVPKAWDQATFADAGQEDDWETQAAFGYRCGISLPLHLPGGRHFVLGVMREQALPEDCAEMTRILFALHVFAAHAQETAWRLHAGPSPFVEYDSPLTARELECLRWTMEGKTAWEVGRILNIAENTAVRHLYNATRKLGCVSKHHAVIQALRQRLIW